MSAGEDTNANKKGCPFYQDSLDALIIL